MTAAALWKVLACVLCVHLPVLANTVSLQRLSVRHAALQAQLENSPFHQPVVVESDQTAGRLTGEIYAILSFPFSKVAAELNSPEHWCDVISLHANTKYCRAQIRGDESVLMVHVGNKTPQALKDVPRIDFKFSRKEVSADYLGLSLESSDGPLGTRDYRLEFEAMPLPKAHTFLHLTYSYATSFSAQWAMRAYLATGGRGKVGFTQESASAGGMPRYIGGVRGVVERNTMRYYLGICSYLETADAAREARLEERLQHWFTSVEKYPRQLHEMERQDYLAMKHAEAVRQQSAD